MKGLMQTLMAMGARYIRAVAPVAGMWPVVMLLAPGSAFAMMNWQLTSPATSPSARSTAPLVWDAARKEMVLFGGVTFVGESLGDTWVWDGTNWTQRFPSTSPSARWGHAMAWDGAHNQVVLFGGDGLNDTWVWDGNNWTQKSPTTSPSARKLSGIAWDAARSRVVLFGGSNVTNFQTTSFNDTWVWDGNNWTQMSPTTSPSVRSEMGMAWDAAHSQVVLFGGLLQEEFSHTFYGDTWVWDGADWTQKSPIASPPPRALHKMAYDEARGQMVMFGGTAEPGLPTDTWVWDGTTWIQQSPLVSPGPRQAPGMAYDPVRQQVVMFGGHTGGPDINETWIWYEVPSVNITITSAVTAATFSVSGSNCQAGSGYTVPRMLEWGPGSTCTVTFDNPVSGGTGVQSVFTGWADGVPDNPRAITVPAADNTYTGNYKTQYLLTTAVVPAGAGSVSGAGFYDANSSAAITATPAPGYVFAGWTPALATNTASSTVAMTAPVTVTANFALITSVAVSPASGQYSDTVTLNATIGPAGGVFSGSLQFKVNGSNAGALLAVSGSGSYSTSYTILSPAGTGPIVATFTSSTSYALPSGGNNTLTITKENAVVKPASTNPATVQVSTPGGTAASITLTGTVQEVADGSPGDIAKAVVTVSLLPAVSGSSTIVCPVSNSAGALTAICSNVPVNAYTVLWNLGGDFYQGPAVNTVLAVFDPSIGFVTGSGTVMANGISADFSLSVKYQKGGTIGGGGVTFVEHLSTGDVTISSTGLTSMAIVGTTAVIDGQASVNGTGSVPLRVTVTDNGSPGVNRDLFGLVASPTVSLDPVAITAGNIQVH